MIDDALEQRITALTELIYSCTQLVENDAEDLAWDSARLLGLLNEED